MEPSHYIDIQFWNSIETDLIGFQYEIHRFHEIEIDIETQESTYNSKILGDVIEHWHLMALQHSDLSSLTREDYLNMFDEYLLATMTFLEFLHYRIQYEYLQSGNNKQNMEYSLKTSKSLENLHDIKFSGLTEMFFKPHSKRRNSEDALQHIYSTNSDIVSLQFCSFMKSLSTELMTHVMLTGPSAIPKKFRPMYENLMAVCSRSHASFSHVMLELRRKDLVELEPPATIWLPDTECSICYAELGTLRHGCCGIPACEKCFNSYINHQVEFNGKIHIECIATECSHPLTFNAIWSGLTEQNRERFMAIKKSAEENGTRKMCLYCMEFYKLSESEIEMLKKKKKSRQFSLGSALKKKNPKSGFLVRCSKCHKVWCFRCQTPPHEAVSCKKNVSCDRLLLKWARQLQTTINVRRARKCPVCKLLTERHGGCPHMTCYQCGTDWCYDCGSRMREFHRIPGFTHRSKFFVLGCSKTLFPNRPHLRRLVRGLICAGVVISMVPMTVLAAGLLLVIGPPLAIFCCARCHRRRGGD